MKTPSSSHYGWATTDGALQKLLGILVHPKLRHFVRIEDSPPQRENLQPVDTLASEGENPTDHTDSLPGIDNPPSQHAMNWTHNRDARRARVIAVSCIFFMIADTFFFFQGMTGSSNPHNLRAESVSWFLGLAFFFLLIALPRIQNVTLISYIYIGLSLTAFIVWTYLGGWYYGIISWGGYLPTASLWLLGTTGGVVVHVVFSSAILTSFLAERWDYIEILTEVPIDTKSHGALALCAAVLFVSSIVTVTSLVSRYDLLEAQAVVVRETKVKLAAQYVKEDFLARMSHDLRTPLHTIRASIKLLEPKQLSAGELGGNDDLGGSRNLLRLIENSSSQLLGIMSDILDFSEHAYQGKSLSFSHRAMDLQVAVAEAVQMAAMGHMTGYTNAGVDVDFLDTQILLRSVAPHTSEAIIPATGVLCRMYFDPRVPSHIHCDPNRLRQLLINLIGNACKFTPRGSIITSVHLATPQQEQALGRHSTAAPGASQASSRGRQVIAIKVADTGIGIQPAALDQIFAPFYQVEETTLTCPRSDMHSPGVGLGLSISKNIVEGMGGRISVESIYGRGTEFTVVLPVEIVADQAMHSGHSQAPAGALGIGARARANPTPRTQSSSRAAGTGRRGRSKSPGSKVRRRNTSKPAPATPHRYMTRSRGRQAPPTPASAPAPRTRRPSNLSIPSAGQACRILLAEDNRVNQVLSRALVRRIDPRYTVQCVEDGQSFLDAIEKSYQPGETPFVSALVDVRMPVMDGISAVRILREREEETGRPPLHCIAMTASLNLREKCEQVGFDAFLGKPTELAQLRAELPTLLPS